MRITVVGAILIVVGTIVLAVVLAALLDKTNRGPEQRDKPNDSGSHS